MSIEKTVRQQAKNALKGNWAVMLAALSLTAAVVMLLEYLMYFTAFALRLADTETGDISFDGNPLALLVTACALTAAALASPLVNGVLRIAFDIADKGRGDIFELFRYFKGVRRYFKTLIINIILSLAYGLVAFGVDAYRSASMILGKDIFEAGLSPDLDTLVLVLMFILSLALKVFYFLIIVYYPLTVYSIDDSKGVLACTAGMFLFSCRHLKESVRLVFSFAGWFALCFFVVPAIYVAPYFTVSVMNSVKWLLTSERNGEKVW